MNLRIITLFTIIIFSNSLFAQANGEELFKQCKACHTLTADRTVGPGLEGITEKRTNEWLKTWITSSTKMIASGDADAKAIFDEYKIPMQDFDFTDEEMDALLDFLGGKVIVEEKATETKTEKTETEETESESEIVEVSKKDTDSDFEKAFKNRILTQFLVGLTLVLLFGVLFAMVKLFFTKK